MPDRQQLYKSEMVMEKYVALTDTVKFISDPGDGTKFRELWLDRHIWDDMGQPETITVTVQPGDLLNNPPQ